MEYMETLNKKAVLIGWVVDMVGSFVIAAILGVVIGIALGASGVSPAEIEAKIRNSFGIQLLTLVLGFSSTALGGYIAARIARDHEIKHGFAVGTLALLTGIVVLFVVPESMSRVSAWYKAVSWIFILPSAVLGAYLRKRTASGY